MDNNKEIELATKPSTDTDNAISPNESSASRPPTPPKRVNKTEDNTTAEESNAKRTTVRLFPRPEVIYKPENTESWMSCLKNLLILFNLLIWVFGAALTGIGIWIKVDRDFWEIQTGLDMKQFSTSGTILIAAGVVIMVIGFVGCCGAFLQSLWMLIVYAVVVILIILLEIAVMALVWTAIGSKDVKEEIKSKAKQAMQEMDTVEFQQHFLNVLQTRLKCCGIDNSDDYKNGIPESCTNPETGFPYDKGCLEVVVNYMKSKAGILGGVAVAVFVLQVAALVLTCCLACGITNAAKNAIF